MRGVLLCFLLLAGLLAAPPAEANGGTLVERRASEPAYRCCRKAKWKRARPDVWAPALRSLSVTPRYASYYALPYHPPVYQARGVVVWTLRVIGPAYRRGWSCKPCVRR